MRSENKDADQLRGNYIQNVGFLMTRLNYVACMMIVEGQCISVHHR